jgi:hypothetical protein
MRTTVQLGSPAIRRFNFGRVSIVGLMLGLMLGLGVLALSPRLHHLLHKDSQSVTHQCLITQLGKGNLVFGFTSAELVTPPPVGFSLLRCAEFQFLPTADYRFSSSRDPPTVFSSITVVG